MPFDRVITRRLPSAVLFLGALSALAAAPASAERGFYVGGNVGQASLKADIDEIKFNEDDYAWKLYGGWTFDWPIFELGVEGGYVDFGSPAGSGIDIDVTGFDAFVIGALDFSIVGIYAKYGVVDWDADIRIGNATGSDDGSDAAYGVGLRFDIAKITLRAEYELFDVADTDDLDMFSVGVVWYFNRR